MHEVYLYRDIWKGIETCQHQKARQHFLACESEQEHSCQIWSSAGNKSLLPIFTLLTSQFTERQIFSQLSFWFLMVWTVTLVLVNGFTEAESRRVWVMSQHHFGPQYWHLQQGRGWDHLHSQPACLHLHDPTLQTLRRDRGMQAQRKREQGWCCFIFKY